METILVNRAYLEGLNIENHALRSHMQMFEERIAKRVMEQVEKELDPLGRKARASAPGKLSQGSILRICECWAKAKHEVCNSVRA